MRKWGDKAERGALSSVPHPSEAGMGAGQRDWIESRWRFEDERSERRALDTGLSEALQRLGDAGNPVMRICGAKAIADLALRPGPGTDGATAVERFPLFAPAANCLAAAVHLEEHPAVRYEIRVALGALTDFAREGEQRLLYTLIQALAEANRAALRAFADALGRYLAKHGAENTALAPLVGFLPFCDDRDATLRCLAALAAEPECEALRDRQAALRVAQATFGEPSVVTNNTLIDTLAVRGARLLDARDGLAASLQALQPPPPYIAASAMWFDDWRVDHHLFLHGTFLVGARLANAQLAGAIFARAHLEGANLESANLLGADLSYAFLKGANLYSATFDDRRRPQLKAALCGANWWDAAAASWRGTAGQILRLWLEANFPAPPAEDVEDSPLEYCPASPMAQPLSAPPRPPAPTVRSAADMIAELKRRAATRAEADPTRGEAEPAHDAAPRQSGTTGHITIVTGQDSVQIRESALPKDTDLMADRYGTAA